MSTSVERDAALAATVRRIAHALRDVSAQLSASEALRVRDREVLAAVRAELDATLSVRFGRALERHGPLMLVGTGVLVYAVGAVVVSLALGIPLAGFPALSLGGSP